MRQLFDMAPLADSDEEAAFLVSAQDAGVLVENLHRACTWFFRAKARLAPGDLPKLGRMCCNPEKIGRKNALALPQSLRLLALTSPDRIWGLFWSRAMCMAMNLFGLVLSNAGCP